MKSAATLFALLVLFLVTLPSCKESEARAEAESNESEPATSNGAHRKTLNVKVEMLTPTTLKEVAVANGVTRPIRDIKYSAELPGKIEYLSADVGDTVKKGQVLARIDFRTLRAQATQAEANHNLAKTTYDRLIELKTEDLVAQQKVDESQSGLQGAEAQLEIARANLAKSTVKSSFRGTVTNKYVEKGEYLAPGMPLYDVVDYRTILLEARLAETQVARITKNAKVTIVIDALGETFEGEVDTVVPTADKVSKTFTLRVKIKNPDLKILVGMSASVRVSAKVHENVLVASQSAVIEESGKRFVFITKDGIASKRPVKLGAVEGDRVVLEEGVSPGDSLVVLGQRDLSDGQPVRVIE